MSITTVSSQSGQSSQSDISSLEASKQKKETEITKLQKEDATKNSKEIVALQNQAQQIQLQITQQKSQSGASTKIADTSTQKNVGPAYSLKLGNQDVENTSTKTLGEPSSETSQLIDLSA